MLVNIYVYFFSMISPTSFGQIRIPLPIVLECYNKICVKNVTINIGSSTTTIKKQNKTKTNRKTTKKPTKKTKTKNIN